MMDIEYKGKNWIKEIKNLEKHKPIDDLRNSIQFKIDFYTKAIDASKIEFPPMINDVVSLYYMIASDYELLACYEWILERNVLQSYNYVYLSVLSYCKAIKIWLSGTHTTNKAIEHRLEYKLDFNKIIWMAASINEVELVHSIIMESRIYNCIINKDYEKALSLAMKLESNIDDHDEVYYYSEKFLKEIYVQLLSKDENKFNQQLVNRIRKYRKNAVGYSTYLDFTSIALIKQGEQLGLNNNFSVIEIPNLFLSNDIHPDKENIQLISIK